MGNISILEDTPKCPITLAGQMAGVAYGTDTKDCKKNYKRGLSCIQSGHGKVLEYADVYMTIENYSIRTIREFGRHTAGQPTYLQSSTRYIDYQNFQYVMPKTIAQNQEASNRFEYLMYHIQETYKDFLAWGIPKEDIGMILPLATTTTISAKYNARTLQGMSMQRLCNRAYWEYRQLMKDLEKALRAYSEEWNTLCDYIFKCKCDIQGYCDEEYSCGKYPKKFDEE